LLLVLLLLVQLLALLLLVQLLLLLLHQVLVSLMQQLMWQRAGGVMSWDMACCWGHGWGCCSCCWGCGRGVH
jgi:hypothetical protein